MVTKLKHLIISVIMALTAINMNPLELFAAQYMPEYLYDGVADFHREIFRELYDPSSLYMGLECMRGSGKTTIASVIFSTYQCCESKDPEFQVISQTAGSTSTAAKIMAKVTKELETNELLIHDYGIKKGKFWGQDHIQVERGDGHTIDFYSYGKRSSIRGARGMTLIDDPQDHDDCKSETVVERDINWLLSDVIPIMLKDQHLIFIGTPISPVSLMSFIKKLPDFKILSFPAENPVGSGESVWKEHYSNEFLAQKKRILGKIRYDAEYNCKPRVSDNPVFQEEWIQKYDPDTEMFKGVLERGLYRVTAMDGAESKADAADNSAIVTLGATPGVNPDVYLLDVQRGKWTVKEGASRLMSSFDTHQQHRTIVESRVKDNKNRTGGDALIVEIRNLENIDRKFLNLDVIKPFKDKVSRALYCQPLIQNCRFHVNTSNPDHANLVNEMIMFDGQGAFHDDMVDALVYALTDIIDRAKRFADVSSEPHIVIPKSPFTHNQRRV